MLANNNDRIRIRGLPSHMSKRRVLELFEIVYKKEKIRITDILNHRCDTEVVVFFRNCNSAAGCITANINAVLGRSL